MQSIHDSTVPAHLAFHAFNAQPYGPSSCMMEEFSADRNQRLELRDTELSNAEIVFAAHRDLLAKGSVKHDMVSKSLSMLAYHITAAITAC